MFNINNSFSILVVQQSNVYLNYLVAFSNPTIFRSNTRRFYLHRCKTLLITVNLFRFHLKMCQQYQ